MTEDIHSCSYFCTRPACVLAQRDELRDSHGAGNQVPPTAQPATRKDCGEAGCAEDRCGNAGCLPSAQPAAQPVQRLSDERIAEIAATPCAVPGSYAHAFARAIEAALQPQGWALVPIEPYPSQRIAGTAEWMRQSAQDDDPDTDKTAAVYRAMIAARPDAS